MPPKELSDQEGIDLAYALFMAAIDSKSLETLKGKALTIFEQYGIGLTEKEHAAIVPELASMLELGKKASIRGQALLQEHQTRGAEGGALIIAGETKQRGGTFSLDDLIGLLFLASAGVVKEACRSFANALDRMFKKVGIKTSGPDKVLAGMVRKINGLAKETQPSVADAATPPRRIKLTGAALTRLVRANKRKEPQSKRAL